MIDTSALQTLRELCLKDLSHGGRGIRNKIETHLVNPLSRALFDEDIESGSYRCISSVDIGTVTILNLTNNTLSESELS